VRLLGLLQDKVNFGVSAGSAMVTPGLNMDRERFERTGIYYDDEYEEAAPPNAGSDWGLELVRRHVAPAPRHARLRVGLLGYRDNPQIDTVLTTPFLRVISYGDP
jgi:hypothetical protein